MPASRRLFPALPLLALAACSSPAGPDAGDASTDASTDAPPLPPPVMCRAGTGWDPTMRAFISGAEHTAAWGLAEARGTTLATADLDGDGYADLLVFDGSLNQRTNLDASPPVFHARVYMNRPREGGGRTFVDATRASNLLALRGGDGYGRVANLAAFADVDNDGDVDAYTGVYVALGTGVPVDPGDRSAILLNDGHGVFQMGPESAATPSDVDAPQTVGAVFTDQDRDGRVDLFVGYFYDPFARVEIGQQHQLFRGRGDGAFDDVTDMVGLTLADTMAAFATGGHRRPLYGVSACDVNGDGVQDLIGAAYGRQWNLLYVSDGARYREVGREAGVAGDANVDYSDDESYRCFCQANPGMCPAGIPSPIYTCPLRGWRAGYNDQPWRLNGNTFSIACGDVDNDGDQDLYTAEIHHPDVGSASDVSELLRNESAGSAVRFTRPGRTATGLVPRSGPMVDEGGLGAGMWDFDGDGRLDVFLAASDYPGQFGWLFHQNADGTFTEVGTPAGFHHPCPHGLAVADFDLDGDVDVIVGSSVARDCRTRWPRGSELRVYENVASQANWTAITLVGRGAGGANRSAIGARVRVTAGGVTQTREVQGSWGHFGLSAELTVHLGLGSNCMIDRVEVRWPDAAGSVETFTDVRANYRVEIRQGEGRVRYLP
jgi:hypothetical protein